jgi:hypothetical protein
MGFVQCKSSTPLREKSGVAILARIMHVYIRLFSVPTRAMVRDNCNLYRDYRYATSRSLYTTFRWL